MLQVHTYTCSIFTDRDVNRDVPVIIIKAKWCSMTMMGQGSKGGEEVRQSNPGVGSTGHYVCTQNVPFTSEPSLAPCPCLHCLFSLPEWRNKVDTPNRLNGGSYTMTKLYTCTQLPNCIYYTEENIHVPPCGKKTHRIYCRFPGTYILEGVRLGSPQWRTVRSSSHAVQECTMEAGKWREEGIHRAHIHLEIVISELMV